MHRALKNTIYVIQRAVNVTEACMVTNNKKLSLCSRKKCVLGIETSCDDTGAAIVDEDGTILGEALHSQTKIHVEMGGIIPVVARDLHRQHLHSVVQQALNSARLSLQDVDAIATTVKPGLIMSLDVGMTYTRQLLQQSQKMFIPIHHMEAHALTARLIHSVEFPFLVLLASGGHCLLAIARDVDDFLLLGRSLDTAPGDSIDKVARALRLKNLPECSGLSGGAAIELMAQTGNPRAFTLLPKLHSHYNCHFSFAGVRTYFERVIKKEEDQLGELKGTKVLPNVADICASFQYYILQHMANRIQRALEYCNMYHSMDRNPTLVMSGGVSSNQYLREGLHRVCDLYNTRLVCPPPHLCTDNGIMIAWNGVEKLKLGRGFEDVNTVDIQARCPLGRDISEDVAAANIRVKTVQFGKNPVTSC